MEVIKVKISKVKQDGLEVIRLPGNKRAFIPKAHLSDHPDVCDALLASYSEGDVIDQALTWSYNPKSRTFILTCKPLLLNAARNETEIVRDFSELETDMILLGVLRQTMSYGVFVEFPNNIVGLAPKSIMADEFVSDTAKLFEVGQTLRAKVTEVNAEKKRFLVSLKETDCFSDEAEPYKRLARLEAYFRDRDRAEHILKEKKEYKHVVSHRVGSLVHATVRSTPGKAVICSLPHGVDAVIPQDHTLETSPKVGDIIEACVLNVDISSKAVTLSQKPDIMERCRMLKSKGKKVTKGKKVIESLNESKGKVLLIKGDFILAQTDQGQLIYVSAKQHLNAFKLEKSILQIGSTVTIGESSFVDGRFLVAMVKGKTKQEKARRSAAVHDNAKKLIGQIVDAVVKSVKETQANVEITDGRGYGRIHATEVLDTMKSGSFPLEHFSIGQKVKAKVIGYRHGKRAQHLAISHGDGALSLLELSTRKSMMESDSTPTECDVTSFQTGQAVTCIINRLDNDILWVYVNRSLGGKVHRLNFSRHASNLENPESYFKPGQARRAKVVRQDSKHKLLELSMSGSSETTFEVGSVVNCKVTNIRENKVHVQLPFGHHGSAFLTDIDDIYQENPLERFEHQMYHRCCILETCKDKQGFVISMRPSRIKKDTPPSGYDPEIKTAGDLKKGQVIRGYVRHCSDKGVFVSLSRNIQGRILLKKLSAFFVKEPSVVFTVGKLLSMKVLSVDKESGKIELSSSSKDTGLEDPVPEDQRKKAEKRKKDGKKKGQRSKEDGNDSGLGEADPFSDAEAEIVTVSKKSDTDTPRLQISSGFSWDNTTSKPTKTTTPKKSRGSNDSDDDDDDSDDEEDEEEVEKEDEPPAKKSRKDLEEEAMAQEDVLYKTEQALMDASRPPETPEDFDRLVASSPNSSLAWIRYMAFYLNSVDIEKARAIAERALKTINFREEQEKLNVWVAYLNLENLYGTEEEVVAVFQRALQQCEPIKVFQQLVSIYVRTDKTGPAEQLYETMVKRFKFEPEVWTGFGTFLMKNGKHDQARRLMQRSFKSLVQKEHVGVIVKFAQLEYRHAEPERGKTMFENILSNYPKRTDIWSIYLDLTIKHGDTDASRHLFERVIHLKLSAKKVKFFFKRYLDFEKKYGDESTINAVKQKAVEYVESRTAVGGDV
ncbi:protein RRP5 homolog [Lytechinus variegatus]|uniref:protein RRP5 homolog n=1 Tax=Lytechinus variegatus TaxID=7654 RepID=UPI001BB24795|nr:protein RRP5 homolog [Lytechinus variegatus]